MRLNTIRKKILGVFLLLLAIPMLLVTIIGSQVIREFYFKTVREDLYRQAVITKIVIEPLLKNGASLKQIETEVDYIGGKIGTRITVINAKGKVLGDSKASPQNMENHAKRPEFAAALQGLEGESIRYSATLRKGFVYVAIPLEKNGKIIGALRTALPTGPIDQAFKHLGATLMGITLLLTLMAALIAARFAKGLTNPIEEMTGLAGEITKGNFNREIVIYSDDELGRLAGAFNSMSKQLSSTISALKSEQGKLMAVLSGISDCVIATDYAGKILFINPAGEKFFATDEKSALGKPFLEVIRDSELYDIFCRVNLTGQSIRKEISLGDAEQVFAVYASPISGARGEIAGSVILFRDITDRKILEQMKTDFVANVSHELRTPLTSIKGFVETLLDGALEEEKTCRHFLQIISAETDRLINLVRDLLDLSQLESGQMKLNIEEVDIPRVIKMSVRVLEEKVKSGGVPIICEVPAELPKIQGDSAWLQEVFINLLDNALKFTQEGEIRVAAKTLEEGIEIRISDTGIGIPVQDQTRLFERFYRVNKGRDRRSGGTGLGLAIVKHILMLHHGTVGVKSKEGAGSTFIIWLPLKQPKN